MNVSPGEFKGESEDYIAVLRSCFVISLIDWLMRTRRVLELWKGSLESFLPPEPVDELSNGLKCCEVSVKDSSESGVESDLHE